MTWTQVDDGACYRRHKTGVPVDIAVSDDLAKALAAMPRKHVVVITTAYSKPFTVDGFSRFNETLSAPPAYLSTANRTARARHSAACSLMPFVSAHDIMAALGRTTLAEAERYTREADRNRGSKRAVTKLNEHRKNKLSQTTLESLGKPANRQGAKVKTTR